MKRKTFFNRLGYTILGMVFLKFKLTCSKWFNIKSQSVGPYFGNGFRNGWADHHSIVIWTRLTKRKELNFDGKPFIHIPRDQHNEKLRGSTDLNKIYHSQIPQGLTLEDMQGSCPGASGDVKITYFLENKPSHKVEINWQPVIENKNFTKQWVLQNLLPGKSYSIILYARKTGSRQISDKISGTFKTPPLPSNEHNQEIGFCVVSCHSYNWRDDDKGGHIVYRSMLDHNPDFYVHTGDIEYYDAPDPWALTEELMKFKWDRLFGLKFQRNFFTKITSYFMKDDHDSLMNDCSPGGKYGRVSFERGIEIFDKEQFPTDKKTYKTVRWGKSIQIWLLEGRNYRSRNDIPDGPNKTILGDNQKKWLFDTVKRSNAEFKIIISPTPILGPDKKGKNDNLANKQFKHEGDQIRNFFDKQENLYLCNGDRHWQYVTHWNDIDLWEFGCGACSDLHPSHWDPNDKRPEHKFLRVKGGYLYVKAKKGKIYFQHCDVNGNVVHQQTFSTK